MYIWLICAECTCNVGNKIGACVCISISRYVGHCCSAFKYIHIWYCADCRVALSGIPQPSLFLLWLKSLLLNYVFVRCMPIRYISTNHHAFTPQQRLGFEYLLNDCMYIKRILKIIIIGINYYILYIKP